MRIEVSDVREGREGYIYLRFGDGDEVVEKKNDAVVVVAADAGVSERVGESECYGLKR